jgi:hypothetical protein
MSIVLLYRLSAWWPVFLSALQIYLQGTLLSLHLSPDHVACRDPINVVYVA